MDGFLFKAKKISPVKSDFNIFSVFAFVCDKILDLLAKGLPVGQKLFFAADDRLVTKYTAMGAAGMRYEDRDDEGS